MLAAISPQPSEESPIVTGRVNDPFHCDAVLLRKIKNEIVFEAFHTPHADVPEFRFADLASAGSNEDAGHLGALFRFRSNFGGRLYLHAIPLALVQLGVIAAIGARPQQCLCVRNFGILILHEALDVLFHSHPLGLCSRAKPALDFRVHGDWHTIGTLPGTRSAY